MPAPRRLFPGGIAASIVLLLLLLTVSAGVYFALVRPSAAFAPFTDGDEGLTRIHQGRRLSAILAVLLMSLLAILAFLVGAYLLIRIGRALVQKRVGGEPTQYVDIWSRYRISEQQIDDLTRESSADDDDERDGPPRRGGPEPE
jgi:hypothetical protein